MTVIDWWNGPLTLVVFFFSLCLLLLTWSIAEIACRTCSSPGTFLFYFYCNTRKHEHENMITSNSTLSLSLSLSLSCSLHLCSDFCLSFEISGPVNSLVMTWYSSHATPLPTALPRTSTFQPSSRKAFHARVSITHCRFASWFEKSHLSALKNSTFKKFPCYFQFDNRLIIRESQGLTPKSV